MSIRIVHIVFIIVSTITSFGFGAWGVMEYLTTSEIADLALAIGAIAAGFLLIWYGNRFFKKLKSLKSVGPS